MRKIKILFTIPNFNTAGSGKHMVDLIRNLDLDRFEPSICCDHEKGEYFKYVKSLGYPVYIKRLSPNRKNYLQGVRGAFSNARFLKEKKFDLIHSFHWKSDWYEPLAARLAGIPWVYTKKSMVWHRHWTIRNWLATWVFTLNPEMSALYPISPKKSTCVGMGPNVDEVITRVLKYNKESLKESLGFKGKKVILTIANLVPVKNIDVLIRSFARLNNASAYHLLIIGDKDSAYGQELEDLAKNLQVADKVTFSGKVLDVEKYINLSDIYVQPTSQYGRSEASGVACMEACAAGLPAIGSDVAGLRFVIGNKDLLFKPDDEQALERKLQEMLDYSFEELTSIGANLQKRMYDMFHMPVVVKDHETIYSRVV